eukprot:1158392-Pelagomonas_calceolata.AAC.21
MRVQRAQRLPASPGGAGAAALHHRAAGPLPALPEAAAPGPGRGRAAAAAPVAPPVAHRHLCPLVLQWQQIV